MTPAVEQLEAAGVEFSIVEYVHDDAERGYGLEAAAKTGIDPDRVFKTLLVSYRSDDGRFTQAVGIVPVSGMLSLKKIGKSLGVKKPAMCEPAVAERITGYVVGGISPFGQRKRLPTVLDETATVRDVIYVSGGQRGLEIAIAPADIVEILDATVADITQVSDSFRWRS